MASVKLFALLVVASVFVSVYSEGIFESSLKDATDYIQKQVDEEKKTEKSAFSAIGEKINQFYDQALEKGKEAAKATADAVSNSYNKLREKTKEYIDFDTNQGETDDKKAN
ncbi:hypothetical protein PGB90_010431 [Kerria lacca]